MKKIFTNKANSIWIGLFCIIIIYAPYFILGDRAFITIHDFLDLTIGHLNNIVRNNDFFSLNSMLPLMDGVSRSGIPFTSPFELKSLCFYLFPGYWAVVANLFIVKMVAFVGMFLLLERYVLRNNTLLSLSVAIIYAIVPFYIDYSFSAAGIPLLLYALLNLYNSRDVAISYVLIAMFGFNSSLALSGLFVCFFLIVGLFLLFFKDRHFNTHLTISLVILGSIYLITNWTILYDFFIGSGIESNRKEMVASYSFTELIQNIFLSLLTGHYHIGNFLVPPIILEAILVLVLCQKSFKEMRWYYLAFIVLASLISIGFLVKLIPLQFFSSFRFERFYFLYPTICFLLFAKSSELLIRNKKMAVCYVFFIINAYGVVRYNTEYKNNVSLLLGSKIEKPTYKQFFDETLFRKIAKKLDIPQDYSIRVVSLGMYPSVAEYNGFWTVDGYLSSYSLEYKHRFRSAMEKELSKNKEIKKYFEEWGNRCYLFSSELGKQFLYPKQSGISLNNLEINTEVLKDFGCKYVFSAVEIKNFDKLMMHFEGKFTSKDSYYNIYVYSL